MGTRHAAPGADRALWLSTIAFTVCFAVWTIFAIIGVRIQQDLGLNETEFGLLVGTPILTGSLSRVFLGIWTDQYGGRIVYVLTMLSAAVATFLLSYATTYPWMLVAALGVGLAGGSFAVGIAYVSKWFPPEKQGTALGFLRRQYRRGRHQIRRTVRPRRVWLADGRGGLGIGAGGHGDHFLAHDRRRSGNQGPPGARGEAALYRFTGTRAFSSVLRRFALFDNKFSASMKAENSIAA